MWIRRNDPFILHMRNGGIQSPITYSAEAEITSLTYCVESWVTKTRSNVRLIKPRESITKLTELLHLPLVKSTRVICIHVVRFSLRC